VDEGTSLLLGASVVRGEEPDQIALVAEQQTPFGIKYVVNGVIRVPVGRSVALRTIWISVGPDDPPRLVTAYPS
jgi:hypothetical protein